MKSLTAIMLNPLSRRLIATLVVSFCAFGNVHAQQTLKIGVVFSEVILKSNVTKTLEDKLEREFGKRDKEVQDMGVRFQMLKDKYDKDAPVLSESERSKRQRELIEMDKDLQRKKREISEDIAQRRNEEMAGLLDRVKKAIKQVADAEKYDLVLQDALIASPKVDITEKVLSVLSK